MFCIQEIRKTVDYQAHSYHPTILNTLAVSTLVYPPQLAWFPDNGWFPSYNYTNQKEKIDWINGEIEKDNNASGIHYAPGMHKFGVRTDTKKYVNRYGAIQVRKTKTHRWEEWREEDKARMLHLSNKVRVKMGRKVGRYFSICTDVTKRS